MKITKSQLKQIIKEEIETDKALLDAIDKLANNIEDLDISIDFLAGAVTGETPVSLGAMSKGMGRAYVPRKGVSSKEFEAPKKELQEISEIIEEELSKTLSEIAETSGCAHFDFLSHVPRERARGEAPDWRTSRDKPYEIAQAIKTSGEEVTNDLIADAVDCAMKDGEFWGGDEGSGEESTWVNNPDKLHHEVVQRLGFDPGEGMPDDYASARPKKAPPSRAWLKRKEMSKEWLAAEAEKEKIKKQQNYN